ncbi:MAG: thioredoxin [Lachnospiraceae bacterium]|nr:thioredoxin [Lachnospiraceae bacterium]
MRTLPLDRSRKEKGERGRLQSSKTGICLIMLGICLMGFGVYRGEMPVIFEKAVNICMECIGIG